jgi:hypothetical protein
VTDDGQSKTRKSSAIPWRLIGGWSCILNDFLTILVSTEDLVLRFGVEVMTTRSTTPISAKKCAPLPSSAVNHDGRRNTNTP